MTNNYTELYSRIASIRPRLNLPKVGTPANYDKSQDEIIEIHQQDIDNIINGKLRQKLGRVDKDGRLLVLPLTGLGTKIRITNAKSEFREIEIESDVLNFGKITVIKKTNSNISLPPRAFSPHNPPPASFHSITVKDNSLSNQRLDSLVGFEIGSVICLIVFAGQTINVKHNTALDDRFNTSDELDLQLKENEIFYFEKRADANGGSWYQLESIFNEASFNTVTIPIDSRLSKIADDAVIASYRKDTAGDDEKYSKSIDMIDNHLDERFGITINQLLDATKISEGSD